MGNFQDIKDSERWYEYIERVYQGDFPKFYEDFEAGEIPLNSQVFLRVYSPERHTNILLARLVNAVNRLVTATREIK